jgi:hypothetical protein
LIAARRRSICKKTSLQHGHFGKNEYFQSTQKPRIAELSEYFTGDVRNPAMPAGRICARFRSGHIQVWRNILAVVVSYEKQ